MSKDAEAEAEARRARMTALIERVRVLAEAEAGPNATAAVFEEALMAIHTELVPAAVAGLATVPAPSRPARAPGAKPTKRRRR